MKQNLIFSTLVGLILLLSCTGEDNSQQATKKKKKVPKDIFQYEPLKVEFLLENSASNFGYISKNTVFKKTFSNLITDLRAKDLVTKVGIGYANGERYCKGKIFEESREIKSFIENLNPQFLQKVNCPTNSSDMVNVVMNSLPDTNFTMKVIFSDFIFSIPDNHSIDNLAFQKDFMKETFNRYLKQNKKLAICIIKFLSEFDGTYYCEIDNKMIPNVKGTRPFYIFLIGDYHDLNYLINKLNFKEYEGFENMLLYANFDNLTPKARLIHNKNKGDVSIQGSPSQLIFKNNAYAGELQFDVKINLAELQIPDFMIEDLSLYQLNNDFQLKKIKKIEEAEASDYTHVFTVYHKNYKPKYEECKISFQLKLPEWVLESSSENDSEPVSETQSKKTFGFKYLVQGILDAYINLKNTPKIYELKIQFID